MCQGLCMTFRIRGIFAPESLDLQTCCCKMTYLYIMEAIKGDALHEKISGGDNMRYCVSGTRCAGVVSLAGMVMLFSLLAGGCSKSVPKCDDRKAVEAVINSVSQDLKKQLSGIAGVQPGMELSDDEWKLIRSGMIIDLENIREQNFDKDTGKRTCAANLMVVEGGKKELTPITYIPMKREGSDELQVEISGLDHHGKEQEAEMAPEAESPEEKQ